MKRRFTKLIAALALLLFVAPPMVGWGQTTYTMTLDNHVDGNNNVHWLSLNTTLSYDDVSWSTNVTPSNSFIGNSKSIAQIGSKNNPATSITISTNDFAGKTITGVSLTGYCTNNTGPTLTITAGNTTVLNAVSLVKTTSTTYSTPQSMQAVQLGQNESLTFTFNSSVVAGICMSQITVTYTTGPQLPATTTTITVPQNFNTDVYTSTTAGTLTASVTETASGNAVSGATVIWASSNTSVATVDQNGAVTLEAAGTTDITATYAGDNTYAGSVGTYQLNVTNSDPNVPGTANNPYTVADIIEMGSSLPSGTVYVSGIVSSFYGDDILDDGNNRYYISEDGVEVEEDEIRVFKGNGLNNQPFANADDVLIGDHVVICGELSIYNSMTQFNAGNYIYSLIRPASYTLTVSSLDHAEMLVFAGNDSEVLFEGEGSGSVVEGASVILSVEPENGYELASLMVDGFEHVNDINGGAYTFNMPDHDVEVTVTTTRLPYYTVNFTTDGVADGSIEVTQGQLIATLPTATAELIPNGYTFVGWYTDNYTNATTAPNYVTSAFVPTSDITLKAVFAVATGTPASLTKMTSSDNFTAGDNVVIVAVGEDYAFAMYQQTKNNSYVDKYAFDGNAATVAADNKNWLTVSAGSTSDTWKLGDATNGFVYNSSGSNDLAISTDNSTDFSLAWNANNDGFTLAGNNRYLSCRYDLANNYFRMGGANLGTSGNVYFDIYKYVAGSASYSDYKTSSTAEYSVFPLEIDGYGAEYDPETNNNAGYYLIASPVSEAITPNQNNGFLSGNYDLYRFDQQQELEWVNYKAEPFEIESGKGYLYASYDGTTLNFCGTEVVGEFNEDVCANVVDVTLGQGWNLIGNPFSNEPYADLLTEDLIDFKDYYKINDNGNELVPADPYSAYGDVIDPMQGVLVWGEEDGEVVFFSGEVNRGGAKKSLSINIRKNRSNVIDRAMVRFNGGGMLPKFQLNPRHTKVYITEGNKDYAVVRSASEAELPVSFRASENGTYTLSVEVNNVEMNYLHLIDNMTGADVDLLATPSYTFEANTTDYASRFRLVFSASFISEDADGDNAFAYYNGSNWTVSNMGEATLQVVDVMGRVLSSETLNGNAEVSINQPSGVYMLRLVNGDNVKVQKVVVR